MRRIGSSGQATGTGLRRSKGKPRRRTCTKASAVRAWHMISILGHLGVWAGLYALAVLVCFSQLAHLTPATILPRWEAMACVLLTAIGVYSFDRVKLFSSWLDPADIAAQPIRYEFLTRRSRQVRLLAVMLLLGAGLIGYRFHPLAPVLVLVAAGSTVLYAPMPRRKLARVKDRLWLKNAYVAVGMAAFAGVITILAARPVPLSDLPEQVWNSRGTLAVAMIVVSLRIFFDAALCDMDDEPTDREFRTVTFATRLGSTRVWNWAGIGRLGISLGLLAAGPVPFSVRAAWCTAMLLGMIALRWQRPFRIRDTVDVRFLPEAVFATIWLALGTSGIS